MWKAPAKVWIRDMYEERKWKSERKKENKQAGKYKDFHAQFHYNYIQNGSDNIWIKMIT